MESPPPRSWTAAKILNAVLYVGLGVASLSALLLLAGTPPQYPCSNDYGSSPTPLGSGSLGGFSFLVGIVGILVALGLKLGLPRMSPDQRLANRAILLATVLLLVAGGAIALDLGRWTCWE